MISDPKYLRILLGFHWILGGLAYGGGSGGGRGGDRGIGIGFTKVGGVSPGVLSLLLFRHFHLALLQNNPIIAPSFLLLLHNPISESSAPRSASSCPPSSSSANVHANAANCYSYSCGDIVRVVRILSATGPSGTDSDTPRRSDRIGSIPLRH